MWTDGRRDGAEPVRPLRRHDADLINTCYLNPSTRTRTAYTLAWDLDVSRTTENWLNNKGQISWKLVKEHLDNEYPEISRFIFAAVTSTGNKGLAVYLAISPLELTESTSHAQKAARVLQHQVLQIFNHHGIGADTGALGLDRDFCSWHKPEKTVYLNRKILAEVQSEQNRTSVVSFLLDSLKRVPFIGYQRKRDQVDLLYHDVRAEQGLARLYLSMLERLEESGEYTWQLRQFEIKKLTGLSEPFIRKVLSQGLPWLLVKDCGAEGWQLGARFFPSLTIRAVQVVNGSAEEHKPTIDTSEPLIRPSDVRDGYRNEWITRAILVLKHGGIVQEQTAELMEYHVSQIPGHEHSKNCRHVTDIIRTIYGNKTQYFGYKEESSVPTWLLHPKDRQYPLPTQEDDTTNAATEIKLQRGVVLPPASPAEKNRLSEKSDVDQGECVGSPERTEGQDGGVRGGATLKNKDNSKIQKGTLIPFIRSLAKGAVPRKPVKPEPDSLVSWEDRQEFNKVLRHPNTTREEKQELLDRFLKAKENQDQKSMDQLLDYARKLVPDILKRHLKKDPTHEFRRVKGYFKMLEGFATPLEIQRLEYEFKHSKGEARVDFEKRLKALAHKAMEKKSATPKPQPARNKKPWTPEDLVKGILDRARTDP